MPRTHIKRETDLQIISGWIQPGQRVLDAGCGRGILLEHLLHSRGARVLGVDTDLAKVQACVRRGVPVYHGDAAALLPEFPDRFFDWVVLSRTVQELHQPGALILEALRVAANVAVGFVNHGFWLNRWHALRSGGLPVNEVFPKTWDAAAPHNPVTVRAFNAFAAAKGIHIANTVFLRGDWRTPVRLLPNLLAGYALYHLRARGTV